MYSLTPKFVSDHPEDVRGLPVALQVMCPRLQEENVLVLMQAITEALSHSEGATSAAS